MGIGTALASLTNDRALANDLRFLTATTLWENPPRAGCCDATDFAPGGPTTRSRQPRRAGRRVRRRPLRSRVAIHDWTFLLGPAFCAGFGNGLLLGYLMYKSGLVPRRMAMLGLVGGPLVFASATAILFGD
jgi:hypothetical protein